MIAVALSGGLDSAAAAVRIHDMGLPFMGVSLLFEESNPSEDHLKRAAHICRYLGIDHHIFEVHEEFDSVRRYFCDAYISGNTPNPCVLCNREIKFDLLLRKAQPLGADTVATGHYVRKDCVHGRYYVARARERNSQEYFLGLVSQDALSRSMFPLWDVTRSEARTIVEKTGLNIPVNDTSQDVCFIKGGGYVPFIRSYAHYEPEPGNILDAEGKVIGEHKGAIYYTIGQRKGFGVGFGRKVYVLRSDMKKNTVTVGALDEWPYRGFIIKDVNYMKAASIDRKRIVYVKVRYRQEASKAVVMPGETDELIVAYDELFSPGQLAVMYDNEDAVLCAGIIHSPLAISP